MMGMKEGEEHGTWTGGSSEPDNFHSPRMGMDGRLKLSNLGPCPPP